jgi:putative SbcD/Mre11-related phosphoesterase
MRIHRDWLLTAQRAAIHLPTATAVVADLHLGYAQVRCRSGEAVPCAELDETVRSLYLLVTLHAIHRLVIAGDLFEDARREREASELLAWFEKTGVELLGVIPGNHDKGLRGDSGPWPLLRDGLNLGDWRVVHGDGELPENRFVQGHIHPCLRWQRGLCAPCYLISPQRLILPAFSRDAAGVNVLHDRRWKAFRCLAISGGQVLDFGEVATLRRLHAQCQRPQAHRRPSIGLR